ncbi:MAG: ABC transporter permease [Candidatus Wallbacteria bacterium]|nr:ABC transporter permease [Candidatus Wallbacteria bacterium]
MKFLALLKKELRELFTPQLVIPLVVVIILFNFMGKLMKKEAEKIEKKPPVMILNQDKGEYSSLLIRKLSDSYEILVLSGSLEETLKRQAVGKKSPVIEIPEDFSSGIASGEHRTLNTYTLLSNFSLKGMMSGESLDDVMADVKKILSNLLMEKQFPGANIAFLKNPVLEEKHVVIGQRMAKTNPYDIYGFISQQVSFIPVILFMVIIMAAQMLASAVATEKEDKTLETLLSCPVSRKSIIIAKMLAAAIIALAMCLFYMWGFKGYMEGIQNLGGGESAHGLTDGRLTSALQQLGLLLGVKGYLLLGVVLFLGILCALSLAVILSVFAENAKSVQGLITPLMILVMLPYFLCIFFDISTLSPALKVIIYANPFSYPFLAPPNIFLGNYSLIVYGIIYQFICFLILVSIAAWIFSTDLILTMKLNFGKRKPQI